MQQTQWSGNHIFDLQVASGTLGLLALVILGIVAAAITVHSRRSRVMVIYIYIYIYTHTHTLKVLLPNNVNSH